MKPWLKLWHEFLDSAKIQRVTETLRARYINLLCVACKADSNGKLPNVETMTFLMRLSLDELQDTLNSLVDLGLIEYHAKSYYIHDWEHWQVHKSPAAIRQKKVRDKRNALRNGHGDELRNDCVTDSATRALAGALAPDSGSDSPEGGQGGNPPDEVLNLAAATESRWPAQNADTFVGDLCQTFDYRLVGQILDHAFDKDPTKLPRSWIRAGCRNEFAKGWKPPVVSKNGSIKPGELPDELEQRVREWEAKQQRENQS